ncbi:hypothetical protein Nepgr_030398 [Nepenthes gracilis]|uniref:Pectinesterase inhibitor domain-containing protein n=1 Tax=Nepenthes gracilis TaxID=150966 RepID=A0AAD3TF90_NEPGR|nr:hypothetical protein Nepgr_030398 [Nepenthes gracilis]
MKLFAWLLSVLAVLSSGQSSRDLITQTCKKTDYYALCVSTLLSDGRSLRADVKGLARIVIEKDLVAAQRALDHAGDLFREAPERGSFERYGTCIEDYRATVFRHLPAARSALDGEKYAASTEELQSAALLAEGCQNQFASEKTPLAEENKAVHDLCGVAQGIIKTLG